MFLLSVTICVRVSLCVRMYICVREWEGAKIKLIKRDYQNVCVQEHVGALLA